MFPGNLFADKKKKWDFSQTKWKQYEMTTIFRFFFSIRTKNVEVKEPPCRPG